MLWTIAVMLVIFWSLGFVSGYTMGGFIQNPLVVDVSYKLTQPGFGPTV